MINYIPSIVIYKKLAYHTKKHTKNQYIGDPLNISKVLSDFDVDEISIVVKDEESIQVAKKIPLFTSRPVSISGLPENFETYLAMISSGYDRIGINFNKYNPIFFEKILNELGSSSLLVNIDLETKINNISNDEIFVLKNCSEIILHDVEKSGSNSGLNFSFHRQNIDYIKSCKINTNISLEGGFNGSLNEINALNEIRAIYYATNYIYCSEERNGNPILINPYERV